MNQFVFDSCCWANANDQAGPVECLVAFYEDDPDYLVLQVLGALEDQDEDRPWLEVKDHGKKLERYTAAVRALKNLRDYWNSRGEVDKAGVDETSYLITTCENIIMNETRSWSSSIDTSEKKKKKTDSEALKDADKDAGDAPSTERRAAGNSG